MSSKLATVSARERSLPIHVRKGGTPLDPHLLLGEDKSIGATRVLEGCVEVGENTRLCILPCEDKSIGATRLLEGRVEVGEKTRDYAFSSGGTVFPRSQMVVLNRAGDGRFSLTSTHLQRKPRSVL